MRRYLNHETDDLGVPLCMCPTCRIANKAWNDAYLQRIMAFDSVPQDRPETYEQDWAKP